MHCLPGGGRAVLVVGVDVVVVHILAREHGGPGGAAHGRRHEGVGEGGPLTLHNLPGFVHDLQGPWKAQWPALLTDSTARSPTDVTSLRDSAPPDLFISLP